ncbi:hypothetical protein HK100_007709 [Physocladia obscura]|uniref:Uncharacterized protein n=1 Tax=Physocladia obscura TaxID=109957 RepID=A0AAD5SRC0_9FUNG|nr:hypothetical protein HK100_007709 [Physocladia obscura]
MTKAVVIVIAGIKKKNNIKPFLEDLESGNTTLDCFLEKFGDIFQDGQNSPGTDGINWDGLQFFGSIIDDVSSVSPVLKLSSLVIFAGYLVATAPEKHRHEIQELAKRFTNLVKDIDSIQEAKASMLDGFPKTKKLLLDRIDDLMCPLINAAEICIYAKFDVWSSIMDELKVKKAQESLQVAQDLLFAVQLNTLVVVDSKIDASLTKIDTTGTQIDTTVTRIDANVTQFNEKFYGQLSDINDKVTLSIDLNKILLQRIKKSRNSAAFDYEEVISSDYESSFFDVGSNFDKALPVMTKVPNTKVVENCMVTKTISELDITGGILYQVYEKAPEIKNSGYLNKKYHYFRNGSLVNDYVTELTDTGPASTKYYSLTTDTVVFNPSCSHVLMIFRCPHLRVDALVGCEHNKLEKNAPFQYKGCLGTPGTFFDGKKDIHTDKTPNYVGFAQRQFIESLKPLGDKYSANINSLSFIGPQFNNYRDIRWYTATNYVPALALQFVTVLQNDISGEIVDLPPLKNVSGRGGVCAPAYWVDLKIIESIYAEHRQIFDMFDSPFDEKTFKHFVQMKTHFVHDEDAHRPRNKLMEENGLLAGLETNQYIINFDSGREYQPHDIAFDHVVNIIRAWSFIKNRGAAAKQN